MLRYLILVFFAVASIQTRAAGDTPIYEIPVIVHVVHDYGNEMVPDSFIYNSLTRLNNYFSGNIADTSLIIDKFKPIKANMQIAFVPATIDPNGNPTKGIEHIYSYHTVVDNYNEQHAQMHPWPRSKYLNIWLLKQMGNSILGHTYYPDVAQLGPYTDGIMMLYDGILQQAYVPYFAGKYLGLRPPCGTAGCTDNDGIPDTPPCESGDCSNLYPLACDTPNVQNIMTGNYGCSIMFTEGQKSFTHNTLNQTVAQRNELVTPANRAATGVDQPLPDLPPAADFIVQRGQVTSGLPPAERSYFLCAGNTNAKFSFANKSWNDTITDVQWQFSNGASTPTSNSLTDVSNVFSQPGWVSLSISATGNNSGTSTYTDDHAVYAADGDHPLVEDPAGPLHYMEFNTGQLGNWPIFNYYKNSYKWEQNTGAGYYDNTSMVFRGFDDRQFPDRLAGGPGGDKDDFFSPAYDLSNFTGDCSLSFMSAGTFGGIYVDALMANFKDTFNISYSIDCGRTWTTFFKLGGQGIANNGLLNIPYAPLWSGEWQANSVQVPQAARTSKVFFRFRYLSGSDPSGNSLSNNFYIDRLNINAFPVGIASSATAGNDVVLFPSPAKDNCYLLVNGPNAVQAQLTVTDISGRRVYAAHKILSGTYDKIEIPSIQWQNGIYFVILTIDEKVMTRKLIVMHE